MSSSLLSVQFFTLLSALKIATRQKVHGLVDPLFGSSWQEWHRYKLHRGIEFDPWVKEWPPSWVYDLTHSKRERSLLTSPRPNGTGLVQPIWNRFGTAKLEQDWYNHDQF